MNKTQFRDEMPLYHKFRFAAGIFVILAATTVAYIPAMRAGFIWDDDAYVTENHLLSAPDGLQRIWFSMEQPSQYFPMTYTTFRWEYALWGLNPACYHITNIILHVINALLLWRLLRYLSIPGAWFAAAVFVLHPVNVESVAWITERKNILMMLFSLLSLLAWMKFVDWPEESGQRRFLYSVSMSLYVIALFSKTTACTLPAALLLILWLKRIPINAKRWLQITPFVMAGLAMGLLVIWWERIHQGTAVFSYNLNFLERVLLAGRALWFYAWKLIWPVNLAFSYTKWKIDWTEPFQYTWLVACLIIALTLWHWREKIGRRVIAAIIFFAVTLSPMLGFFKLYTFLYTYVADHYQYMACIGLISLIAGAGYQAITRFGKWGEVIAAIVGSCILGLLGWLTYQQCHIYKNSEILWRDTIQKSPESWLAHNNLATELRYKGELDEAVSHNLKAMSIVPNNVLVLANLGESLKLQGKLEEAYEYFRKAIQNMNKHGDVLLYSQIYAKFGDVLIEQGKLEEASFYLKRSLEINPDYFPAQLNLAIVSYQKGMSAKALSHIDKALKIRPESPEANKIRQLILRQEQLKKAVQKYEQVLKIHPNDPDAHNEIAKVFLQYGKFEEAIRHFSEAIRLKPDWLSPINNLAYILAAHPDQNVRDADKAITLAERAAGLTNHDNEEILDTLSVAYASAGEFEKAITTAQKALDLAVASGKKKLADEIKMKLNLYRQGKPYRISVDGK